MPNKPTNMTREPVGDCPGCGEAVYTGGDEGSVCVSTMEKHTLTPGTITLCNSCGFLLILDARLQVRPLTEEEEAALLANLPILAFVRNWWRAWSRFTGKRGAGCPINQRP